MVERVRRREREEGDGRESEGERKGKVSSIMMYINAYSGRERMCWTRIPEPEEKPVI